MKVPQGGVNSSFTIMKAFGTLSTIELQLGARELVLKLGASARELRSLSSSSKLQLAASSRSGFSSELDRKL